MRQIIRFFVERELLGNTITVIVFLFGILALLTVRRDLFPPVDFNILLVSMEMKGASPEQVEKLLVNPLEQAIRGIDGLKKVESTATYGRAVTVITLEPDSRNPNETIIDIRSAVDKIRGYPEAAEKPIITKLDSSQTPVLGISVSAKDSSYYDLRQKVKRFAEELESLPGVAAIRKNPWYQREIVVAVEEKLLQKYYVSLSDVVRVLREQNQQLPGGDGFRLNGQEISIKTDGEFRTLDDILNTVIRSNVEGYVVRVRDISKVSYRLEKPNLLYRTNGERSFIMTIVKKQKADALRVVERLKEKVKDIKSELSKNVYLTEVNRFTEHLKNRISILSTNMVIGIILVLIVLAIFLPFRVAIVVAMGIPFAMLANIMMVHMAGLSLNLLSLIGLIIVSGMVVDDVVVVVENVYRKFEKGAPIQEAVINGTWEMVPPVLAAVATTMAAFFPLMFMSGIFGQFVFQIPLMVVGALAFSLLEGFFIAPCHFKSFVRSRAGKYRQKLKQSKSRYQAFLNKYGTFIRHLVRRRYWGLLGFFGIFIVTGILAANMRFILFPSDGLYTFFIRLEASPNVSLKEMEQITKKVEGFVRLIPKEERRSYISQVGTHQNEPNDPLTKRAFNYSQIQVELVPENKRKRDINEIIDDFKSKFQAPEGLERYSIELQKMGPPQGRPISINIYGEEFTVLREIVAKVKAVLKNIDGVHSIRDSDILGKEEVRVVPDPIRMSQAGLSVLNVSQTIRAAFDGMEATSVRRLDEEMMVKVQMNKDSIDEKLENLKIGNRRGDLVPLRSIAKFESSQPFLSVRHENFKRVFNVTAEVDLNKNTAFRATKEFVNKSKGLINAYPGYSIGFSGEAEDTNESITGLKDSFLLAAVLIYAILLVTFNNFWQPLLVLFSIPMGVVGVLWALFLHDRPISFMAMLGLVSLAGIIVNNSIVFIDFFNKKRREGVSLEDALVQTAMTRLRPIILTSLTTVFGLLPTAYGLGGADSFVMALTIALSWGLAIGSILATVFLPCQVAIFYDLKNYFVKLSSLIKNHRVFE